MRFLLKERQRFRWFVTKNENAPECLPDQPKGRRSGWGIYPSSSFTLARISIGLKGLLIYSSAP